MKITNGTGYGSITCGLSISKDLTVYSQVPIDHLETVSVGYAVCHFLKNAPKTAARYILASYRMRLAKGTQRKVKTCWLYGPSSPLELPGEWARIRLSVGPEGITVERVELYANGHRVQPSQKVPR